MIEPSRALTDDEPHLIDEWQEIPLIWYAVRGEVDRSTEKGRSILTDSATPLKKGVMHSGAGRIGNMRMRPMSLYESGDSNGNVPLMSLFDHDPLDTAVEPISLSHLIDLVVRGGFPNDITNNIGSAMGFDQDHLEKYAGDAVALDGKSGDTGKIGMVIRPLARNESTVASIRKIVEDVKEGSVSDKAVNHYMDVLERMFMISDQPPFDPNYGSPIRVKGSSKRHLVDPSLSCAALGLTPEKLLDDPNTFGFMFEGMYAMDLDIYASSIDGKPLY